MNKKDTDISPKQFEDKMKTFESNLSALFSESKTLEMEIQKQIKEMKYE